MTRTVTAVCRVAELHEVPGRVGVTAIDKRPVTGAVAVRRLGVHGDVQADREHHGGPDKAVYAFSADLASHLEGVLGHAIAPGWLGENLRVDGDAVEDAIIGERWRVGSVVLEVSGPRNPCATYEHWVGRAGWMKDVIASGRSGVYLRVREPGTLTAGDAIETVAVPAHGVSVRAWWRDKPAELSRRLLSAEDDGWHLADYLRPYVRASAGERG